MKYQIIPTTPPVYPHDIVVCKVDLVTTPVPNPADEALFDWRQLTTDLGGEG